MQVYTRSTSTSAPSHLTSHHIKMVKLNYDYEYTACCELSYGGALVRSKPKSKLAQDLYLLTPLGRVPCGINLEKRKGRSRASTTTAPRVFRAMALLALECEIIFAKFRNLTPVVQHTPRSVSRVVAYLADDVLGCLVHSELRTLPSLGLLGLVTRPRRRRLLCVSSTHD